ncbi:uncharacterized protein LOC126318610 [Schistocerca gregaria]|uniref:uncharacterized protein LOC126318610 n=1 Tax=Schistocerca gregaria TaxID=7010 RepID=UPI00211E0077|nr:uncharacterized protein LOC126318610 [Schistocerca gregaria]
MSEHSITKYFKSAGLRKANPYLERLVGKHESPDLIRNSCEMQPSPILSIASRCLPRSSNLSKRKSAVPRQKGFSKNKRYQQLTLSLGQTQEYECPQCRMLYCKGSASDEKLHAKYHRDFHEPIFNFSTWRPHQVLYESDDRTSVILVMDHQLTLTEKSRLASILSLVDTLLSFSSSGPEHVLKDGEKVYLYIQHHKVVGVLRAERIKEGFRLTPCLKADDAFSEKTAPAPNNGRVGIGPKDWSARMNVEDEIISVVPIPENASLGISRIWVCESARKKGIAKKLVDTCRSSFFFSCVVPKSSCAMSQPTADGRKFGCHYFETSEFLIYSHR